jgi:hypothetical protein
MNIVVAIHSFTKLWLLYFVSIIMILFYTYYFISDVVNLFINVMIRKETWERHLAAAD